MINGNSVIRITLADFRIITNNNLCTAVILRRANSTLALNCSILALAGQFTCYIGFGTLTIHKYTTIGLGLNFDPLHNNQLRWR